MPALSGAFVRVEGVVGELVALAERCRGAGMATDYADVKIAVIDRFASYGRADLKHGRVKRATYVLDVITRLSDEVRQTLDDYLNGVGRPPAVWRYVTGKVTTRNTSFIGAAANPMTGATAARPVFFVGYGHFDRVRADVPNFRAFGVNMIQIEIGPRSVVKPPRNGHEDYHLDLSAVEADIERVLRRAEEYNVAVSVLLSPHYFPSWAFEKWPELRHYRGGFLPFTIDAPQARSILDAYLRAVMGRLRRYRSLHNVCLTNEPVYLDSSRDRHTRRLWHEYLRQTHGRIAAVNVLYGTQFETFADVDVPRPDTIEPGPGGYDWIRFNMRRFAAWHAWMAQIVHEVAPDRFVNAKIMNTIFDRDCIVNGVDPEEFCRLGAINGCDNYAYYNGSADVYLNKFMFYDLLRSMSTAPIYNSEDHVIRDRDGRYIPEQARHVRTDLWQGAIHGRSASTLWVWERTDDRSSDFEGSILHRPDCVAEVGRTNLDLNRLAFRVTSLQNVRADTALLYSIPSIGYCPAYGRTVRKAYKALTFSGIVVDFMSERQLRDSPSVGYRRIIVPSATHVLPSTPKALERAARAGTHIVLIGRKCLMFDPYDRPQNALRQRGGLASAVVLDSEMDARDLAARFVAWRRADSGRPIELIDRATNEPVWNVEWRCAVHGSKRLLSLCNYGPAGIDVVIRHRWARHGPWRDVISMREVAHGAVRLAPLTPMLLECEAGADD